mgnify:CR=1 FL=1
MVDSLPERVPDRNAVLDRRGKPRVQTINEDEMITVQSDAMLADIHHVLGQWSPYGLKQNLDAAEVQFADITHFTDFADAMLHAKQAEEVFMQMPSKVREVFNHDVAEWLDSAHDETKRQKLIDLGILPAPEPETPPAAPEPVPPAPPPAAE